MSQNYPVDQRWRPGDSTGLAQVPVPILGRNPGDHLAPTIVAVGDSITVRNSVANIPLPYPSDAVNNYGIQMGSGYLQMGCAALGQRLRFAGVFGAGGTTSDIILAQHFPKILGMNPRPGWCVIQCNQNDSDSLSVAASMANHVEMARQLRAAGIRPIMATPLFGSGVYGAGKLSTLQQQADYLRKFAEINGLPLLDFQGATQDPVTGGYKTGFNEGADSTHPSPAGWWAMAQEFLKLPLDPWTVGPTWWAAEPVNLLANGPFTGAGPVPAGWAVTTPGAGFTDEVVPGDPGMPGQWLQVTSTANSDHQISATLISNANFNAGDVLAFTGTVQTVGTAGVMYPKIRYFVSGLSGALCWDTGSATTPAYRGWCADMDRAVLYNEILVPAAPGGLTVVVEVQGGPGVVRFGNMRLVNLTRYGIIPSLIPVLA